jgi:hypothetical protein
MLNMSSFWKKETRKTNHPAACPEDQIVAPLLPLQLSAAALANTVAAAATKRVMKNGRKKIVSYFLNVWRQSQSSPISMNKQTNKDYLNTSEHLSVNSASGGRQQPVASVEIASQNRAKTAVHV